jgi:thiol-disulfide isomerase/thioredoxin
MIGWLRRARRRLALASAVGVVLASACTDRPAGSRSTHVVPGQGTPSRPSAAPAGHPGQPSPPAAPTTVAGWLETPAFAGFPLVVDLMGSWCSNCIYSIPALKELHARHRATPLRIVSFALEFTDDRDHNRERAIALKRRHEIPWDVIPIDGTIDSIELAGMRDTVTTEQFPVLIFVRADGSVAGILEGFPPSTSPRETAEVTGRMEELAREIVSPRPPTSAAPVP